MIARFVSQAVLLAALTACTWVKPTPEGTRVVVSDADGAAGCVRLGTTTTGVKHEVASIDRKQGKVETELATLARNEAAVMGGDTIVAEGPVTDGSRVFGVFRCRD